MSTTNPRSELDVIRDNASALPEARIALGSAPDVVYLTKTQVITNADGPPRIIDRGNDGSRIQYIWQGPASDPVFLLQFCRDWVWEHIDVVCESGCESVFRCVRAVTGGGSIAWSNHLFRDILL